MPKMTESNRVERLEPPDVSAGPVDIVLDTDTFNEIDDQFALVYAMLSPARINLQAVYAAPFVNQRAATPSIGMGKSYDEIVEVYRKMDLDHTGRIFAGSERWMASASDWVASPAVDDLIARVSGRPVDSAPLYVVSIGAPTNVASALVREPGVREKIVVVWLGGHPRHWHHQREFNLQQDLHASRVLFDSGVPLVRVPCATVAQLLRSSAPEMKHYLSGGHSVCTFLLERFCEYEAFETPHWVKQNAGRPIAYGKEIWDVAPIAWLVDPAWCQSVLSNSPVLNDNLTFSFDPRRHLGRELITVNRDAIFGDLFTKLRGLE